ncbi:MAG: PorV/PorQ family protein [Ignavibacteriales bacterium]|nr:PorV/PorQ family protein [Ignavibacteriales bacterium]
MKNILFCLSISILAVVPSMEGQSKTGTTIGQFLLIEPSGRISAMGNAGVAVYDEAMSSYYNPASLGHIANSSVQFSHNAWFAGIVHDYFAASLHISNVSSLALSISALNSGEIAVRTVEQPLGTGEQYTVADYSIGIGYGQKITERFSAGMQVSYIQETIWHSTLSAISFNFGTLYKISDSGLLLGASISNVGTRGRYNGTDIRISYDYDATRNGDNGSLPAELLTDEFSLPIVFRVGCAYPVVLDGNNEFHFAVDAFHPSDNSESISFGGEYKFMNTFALRAGYQHLFQTDSELGLTLGAGILWDIDTYVLHVDYSMNEHKRLGNTQRMTIGMDF